MTNDQLIHDFQAIENAFNEAVISNNTEEIVVLLGSPSKICAPVKETRLGILRHFTKPKLGYARVPATRNARNRRPRQDEEIIRAKSGIRQV